MVRAVDMLAEVLETPALATAPTSPTASLLAGLPLWRWALAPCLHRELHPTRLHCHLLELLEPLLAWEACLATCHWATGHWNQVAFSEA